ncbi:MAG: tetratricopeptide repeat protein [Rubrivivax sp.]|nr:tetratricopeptide repeat protein [Rubrivivax sp.]
MAAAHTLLFTDVVDSTALAERLGDAAAAALWAQHDRAARDLFAQHRGREIDRTDGFFAMFDEPADAMAFGFAYHAAAAALGLQARVALHTAAVALRENDAADVARGAKPLEVEGLAKPYTARLMGLARGGQTLASAATVAALQAVHATAAHVHSHGHYRLKGVADPVEVFELQQGADPAFVPPPDSDKAYRVVRLDRKQGGLWQPVREVPHNLPAERDTFVGRIGELRALALRLEGGERLITVLGPGGTGKTRVVRRYALAWLGDWPGGVYFCDLSEARGEEGVLAAVAAGLGVPPGPGDAAVQLGHAIAARGSCLVILDNAEQVLAPVAALVTRWLDRAGSASVLVTSRELLRLDGEGVFPLDPMPVDDTAADAVALFETRARAQRPDFAIDDGNRTAVLEAVRLLDGLPLAIELAAARVRLLSPAQIVERLRDRFALLAGPRHGAAARQATLRAAIDWSWQLLQPWEQAALAQCAVFEGGFTLSAAEQVLDLAPWPTAPSAMDVVQALLDKSLLRTEAPARLRVDEPHFGMYVSIHTYARERLQAAGEAAAAEVRHGRHYAAFGAAMAPLVERERDGRRHLQTLALDRDNLLAACRRALARGDIALAAECLVGVWPALQVQGPLATALALGAALYARSTVEPSTRLAVCRTYGIALVVSGGSPDTAAAVLGEALGLARQLGRGLAEGEVLSRLGELHATGLHIDDARAALDEALVVTRRSGDRVNEAHALGRLAALDHHQGRWDTFEARCQAALALYHEAGGAYREPQLLNLLGMRTHDQGHTERALSLFGAARERSQASGNRLQEATSLGNIAAVYADLGRTDEALRAQQGSLALHREIGNRTGEGIQLGEIGSSYARMTQFAAAFEHLEAALAIAREVGNRRHELHLLGTLAEWRARRGQLQLARECLHGALQAARSAGYRVATGRLLAGLGRIEGLDGHLDAAGQALAEGETLLREAGDRLQLARLLCTRGRIDLAQGRTDAAAAALAEAEAAAQGIGVAPGSELREDIEGLRQALAAPDAT